MVRVDVLGSVNPDPNHNPNRIYIPTAGFALRLRHSPWANFDFVWRNTKITLSPKWRK